MSSNLKSKKPRTVVMKICLVEIAAVIKKGMAKNVTAWPANSSATTSRGSALPVAAIAAGANLTQITEPAKAKAAITINIRIAGASKCHIRANMAAGGSEPHVPGASGSRPRPKHDVSILFIVAED